MSPEWLVYNWSVRRARITSLSLITCAAIITYLLVMTLHNRSSSPSTKLFKILHNVTELKGKRATELSNSGGSFRANNVCMTSAANTSHFDYSYGGLLELVNNNPRSGKQFFESYVDASNPDWPVRKSIPAKSLKGRLKGINVLFVTDKLEHTPFFSGKHASLFATMARKTAEADAHTSILFTSLHFLHTSRQKIIRNLYREHNVDVIGLTAAALSWGGDHAACNHTKLATTQDFCYLLASCRVLEQLRLLNANGIRFDVIHFPQSGALSYCTQHARQGGLAPFLQHTAVTVGVAGSTNWAQLMNGHLPQSRHDILRGFYERTALEIADATWSPSEYIAAYELARTRTLPKGKPMWLLPVHEAWESTSSVRSLDSVKQFWRKTTLPIELVFVGEYSSHGGLELFLQALEHIMNEIDDQTLNVTLLGKRFTDELRGDMFSLLQSQIAAVREHGLLLSVQNTHDNEEIVKYLTSGKRIGVFPAVNDHSSVPLIVAARYGVPLVVTRTGGMTEGLHAYKTVAITRPRAKELAQAVLQVMQLGDVLVAQHQLPTSPMQPSDSIIDFTAMASLLNRKQTSQNATKLPSRLSITVVCVGREAVIEHMIQALQAENWSNDVKVHVRFVVLETYRTSSARILKMLRNISREIEVSVIPAKHNTISPGDYHKTLSNTDRGLYILLADGFSLCEGWYSSIRSLLPLLQEGLGGVTSAFKTAQNTVFIHPPVYAADAIVAPEQLPPVLVVDSRSYHGLGGLNPHYSLAESFFEFLSAMKTLPIYALTTPIVKMVHHMHDTLVGKPSAHIAHAAEALLGHVNVRSSVLLASYYEKNRRSTYIFDSATAVCAAQGCQGFHRGVISVLQSQIRVEAAQSDNMLWYPAALTAHYQGCFNATARLCEFPTSLVSWNLTFKPGSGQWNDPRLPGDDVSLFRGDVVTPRTHETELLVPVLRWLSDIKGDAWITIEYRFPTACGSGACIFVFLGDFIVWQRCGGTPHVGLALEGTSRVRAEMTLQSAVWLVVDPLGDAACDDVLARIIIQADD